MADICIAAPNVPQLQALVGLLKGRRLNVTQAVETPSHTVIQAGTQQDRRGAVYLAKKMGAKRVIMVNPSADAWAVTDEMGGRMINVDLPRTGLPALRDAGLMLLADFVAAPFGAMVAADAATGELPC